MSDPTAGVLFCGAGGGILGLRDAEYDVKWGVDYDETTIETVNSNLDDVNGVCADITAHEPEVFYREHDLSTDIDVLLGGPPCQGFSVANAYRDVDDERNNLVFVFADHVAYLQPDAFIMENVTGMMSGEMKDLFDDLLEDFEGAGYTVDWEIHNAADYGVPQKRRRVIVVGVKDGEPSFPETTHSVDEYIGTGDVLDIPIPHEHKGGGRTSKAVWRDHTEPSHTITTQTNNVVRYDGEWRWWEKDEMKILQTFPDSYTFVGNDGDFGRQLGNAVPPKLMCAVGSHVSEVIE